MARFLVPLLLAALCVQSHAQIRIHFAGAPTQMPNMGSQLASDTPLGKALDEIFSDMASDSAQGSGDDKEEMPKFRVIRMPSLNSLFSGMRSLQSPAAAAGCTPCMRIIPLQQMATQLPTTFSGPMTLPKAMPSGMTSIQIEHSNGHTARTETTTDAEGKVHTTRTVTADAANQAQDGQAELMRMMEAVMSPLTMADDARVAIEKDVSKVADSLDDAPPVTSQDEIRRIMAAPEDVSAVMAHRDVPISNTEAKAAVAAAVKPEEVNTKAGRDSIAADVAAALGLDPADVRVAVEDMVDDVDQDASDPVHGADQEEDGPTPTFVPATETTVTDLDDDKAAAITRVIEGAEAEKDDAYSRFEDAAARAMAAKAEEEDGEEREQGAKAALEDAIGDATKEENEAEEMVQDAFVNQETKQNSLKRLEELKTKISSSASAVN